MATYFCSDLHGEYDLFCRLLDKIDYSSEDKVFVLGDMIGKGRLSLKLVELIRENGMMAIVGNHEYDFLQYYNNLMREYDGKDEELLLEKLREYFPDESTQLTFDMVDYLDSLPYYLEGQQFICVHAGLKLDDNGRILPMKEQSANVMLFDRHFKEPTVVPINSKTVFFGHTPCSYDNNTGDFIKTLKQNVVEPKNIFDYAKIQLDTGVDVIGRLGLLCGNNMDEIYVRKTYE